MKVKFVCETCGKEFDNREGACECEVFHKKEQERAERLAAEKTERQNQIRELWDGYVEDYGTYPIEALLLENTPFIKIFGL